jgi:GcrA cell cycle regulator
MEWSDETIEKLRVLWTEGLSTAEIGRRMGISKNAVVGKAHRLLLTSRPSPIRRDVDGSRPQRPAGPKRITGPTLPSMAAISSGLGSPISPMSARAEPAIVALVAAEASPEPALRPVPAPRPLSAERRRAVTCCWPIGEPGTRSFRFCDDESVTGKPYCAAHVALAYVRVRDRREDAA